MILTREAFKCCYEIRAKRLEGFETGVRRRCALVAS